MPNQKISQLTAGAPAQAGDLIPIARGSSNFSLQVSNIGTLSVSTTITSTQFLAMTNAIANCVQLLAAPSSGQMYEVAYFDCNMQYGGTAYTTGTGALVLGTNNGGNISGVWGALMPSTSPGIKSTASIFNSSGITSNNPGALALTNFNAQALYIGIANATNYLAGNSNFVINVYYRILSVA